MATPQRTKQVSLRFPLPLLSKIKSQADTKQQAIADWIIEAIDRQFEVGTEPQSNKEVDKEPAAFVLHPDLLAYVEGCLAPLHLQISDLRTQLGESKA